MCDFRIRRDELLRDFGLANAATDALFAPVRDAFPGMVEVTAEGLSIPPQARPLTRMIARAFDAYDLSRAGHSPAI
jgi:oxygen-independent coproporphyrinogen-3 oxidase